MKKLITSIFISLLYLCNAYSEYIYVNFDDSMHAPANFKSKPEYITLKKIYEQKNPSVTKKEINSIPKIIHQIWLGPRPISDEYKANTQRWKQLHPNWEYKLWSEKDIKNWTFPSKDLFDKASSYQEKSDLLRYEILKKYGGLYVDMDYKPLKNFDDIHNKYRFYASIEPLHSSNQNITIANSILASTPNVEILDIALKNIREHWVKCESGFKDFASSAHEKSLIHLAVNRTMIPLHNAIIENATKTKDLIIFPTSYMGIEERDSWIDNTKAFLGLINKKLYFRTPKKETMAVQKRGKRKLDNLNNIQFKQPWYKLFVPTTSD